jgi:hypothetical protein
MVDSSDDSLRARPSPRASRSFIVRDAAAQQPQGFAEAPPHPEFLSRYDFNMSAAKLAYPDQRFSWDVHWGGDFDLVDYVSAASPSSATTRGCSAASFARSIRIKAITCSKPIGSYRVRTDRSAGRPQSCVRHLGDRFKPVAVAENSLGPRVMRKFTHDAGLRIARQPAQSDCARLRRLHVDGRHRSDRQGRCASQVGLYGRSYGQIITVDKTIAGRGNQGGGRVEAGVQLNGVQGVMQLFVGAERVIDADQLDRVPRRWAFVGFRLLRN